MSGLRQIPRLRFDKGNETARKTAIVQAQFIAKNFNVLKELDNKSRPKGWKVKKFRELVQRLNNKEMLEMVEYSYIDEFYESVISEVYNVQGYKKEFYKGHIK